MRILQITKKYPQIHGGDATAVSNLETQFRKRGHSVHILTVNCDLITPSEWVIRIGPRFSPEQLDTFSFRRVLLLVYLLLASFSLVKKTKPDLIHSHSADVGFMFSVAARLRGIPMVHTCHGLTYANREASILKRYGELFLLACSSFRRIIVVDKPSQVLLEKKGFSRVAYIPNGVDEEFFSYQMPPADRTQVVFLFLGRLEEQKGLDYLIEAVRLMKDFSNAFKVIIAGTGSLHDYLQERIQEANISDCVELKGRLETSVLPDLYSSADIFVLPSLWEGMPLTVLEAWSCGLPIIVTKVGNIPFFCIHMKNALIVEPKNSQALCQAMLTLAENRDLRWELGLQGKKLVHDWFSWKRVAQATMELYEGLMAGGQQERKEES